MTDPTPIVNIGEFAKPIDTFIKSIEKAVGTWYEPTHMKKRAMAERYVAIVEAMTKIEISEIERRSFARMLHEAVREQENIDRIVEFAKYELREDARPEELEDD